MGDGSVQLPAAAAIGLRHLQELRGPLARGLHGWQWRGHAWQGHLLRAQGGGWWCRWQEEVSAECGDLASMACMYANCSISPCGIVSFGWAPARMDGLQFGGLASGFICAFLVRCSRIVGGLYSRLEALIS